VSDADLFLGILLVAAAAFVGGAIAQMLRLPTIIGFLAAGVAIGPGTPGPVGDLDYISSAADVGVILLMFGIGIQFSFRQLVDYRRLILLGGGIQILATMVLGVIVGSLLGLGWTESVIVGFLAANTSTVVATKVLEGRQQLRSTQGIAAVNISILQDISAVLMVIVVPSLGGERLDVSEFLFAIAKGVFLIGIAYLLSVYVLPQLWRRIAHARSRELSLLAAVTLAIGLATGSGVLGLSIAFGAFLAGLAVSENEYGYATLSDIIPLRELFASVFFVSMGMLIEPEVAWQETTTVLALVLLIVVGKGLLSMVATRIAGLMFGTAVLTGLILAQVGEFSFVIARVALDEGVIEANLGSAFLVAAVISILISPGLVRIGPWMVAGLRNLPIMSIDGFDMTEAQQLGQVANMRRHVVICGYGDAALALVRSLKGRNLPFVIIDNNPFIFESVRRAEPDLAFIYGDATRPEVLELARVQEARVLAVTFPNPNEAQMTVFNARIANPSVDIVARGSFESQDLLRRGGSSEVVDPEFEASLEFVRHVLHRFGVDAREITMLQQRWRSDYYRER
jgi:monovalent cation:H+ antiporter-2, CPA2 family